MAGQLPEATRFESLRFGLTHLAPSLARGLFRRRRTMVRWTGRLGYSERAAHVVGRLRDKYGDPGVRLKLPGSGVRILLWGRQAIRHVLENSPDPYGPPEAKLKGMGHFQPNSVTLSTGATWRDRRRFNEAVLDFGLAAHGEGPAFHAMVLGETRRCLDRGRDAGEVTWIDLADLFERVALQVIFGAGARDDRRIASLLEKLMSRANTPIGLREESKRYLELRSAIDEYLQTAEEGSLAGRAAGVETTEQTDPHDQFPHWLFATKDTLAANTARALAVIAADPAVAERVRKELDRIDPRDAAGIAELSYLAGCVQEAMRLWPTTPILSRRLAEDDEIAGFPVEAGSQILISNTFGHRDAERVDRAHDFFPERWLDGDPDVLFNHLSRGPQVCAGKDLALFLARAVLADLLRGARWKLKKPTLDPNPPLPFSLNVRPLRFEVSEPT